MDHVLAYLDEVAGTLSRLPLKQIGQAIDILEFARAHSQQVFLLGNGGSAATATHFACDLSKGTMEPDQRRFRAIALADNMPVFSAWANDTSYDQVFSEQLSGLLNAGDVVVAISCSGESPNVLNALRTARRLGAVTVGMTGGSGGSMPALADVCIRVPGDRPEPVEDAHLAIEHAICNAIRHRARERRPVTAAEVSEPSPQAGQGGSAVFLDRDGVINENRPEYVLRWEDVVFLPGVFEPLWELSRNGRLVIIISNQSAIGRGLVSRDEVDAINTRIRQEIERRGGRIDSILYCPHRPDEGCACRKPQPGLLLEAARRFNLDLERSFIVGDSAGDVLAGLAVHAAPFLVLTGKGNEEQERLKQLGVTGHKVVQTLRAAADLISAAD